jgi:hypothetical protein
VRHRWLVFAGCAIVVIGMAGLTWSLWVSGGRGAEQATVIVVPFTIVGVGIAAAALVPSHRDPDQVRRHVDELARIIGRREELAITQLPCPADVGFSQPLTVRWRTDGGGRHGSLAQVSDYYRSLARGRLVVLGLPGSGKTVLARGAAPRRVTRTAKRPPAVPAGASAVRFRPGGHP